MRRSSALTGGGYSVLGSRSCDDDAAPSKTYPDLRQERNFFHPIKRGCRDSSTWERKAEPPLERCASAIPGQYYSELPRIPIVVWLLVSFRPSRPTNWSTAGTASPITLAGTETITWQTPACPARGSRDATGTKSGPSWKLKLGTVCEEQSMPVAKNDRVSPAKAGSPFSPALGIAARSSEPRRIANACPFPESPAAKSPGTLVCIELSSKLDWPAAVSTTIASRVPGTAAGQSRSTRLVEAYKTWA